MKNPPSLAKIVFAGSTTPVLLPYKHFCGGTSVKLPRSMADFRQQWVTYSYGSQTIGRHAVTSIEFLK